MSLRLQTERLTNKGIDEIVVGVVAENDRFVQLTPVRLMKALYGNGNRKEKPITGFQIACGYSSRIEPEGLAQAIASTFSLRILPDYSQLPHNPTSTCHADRETAERFNCVIRPLAVAELTSQGDFAGWIGPALVPKSHLLAIHPEVDHLRYFTGSRPPHHIQDWTSQLFVPDGELFGSHYARLGLRSLSDERTLMQALSSQGLIIQAARRLERPPGIALVFAPSRTRELFSALDYVRYLSIRFEVNAVMRVLDAPEGNSNGH